MPGPLLGVLTDPAPQRHPPTWDVRCGTEAGYKAHRRRNEDSCSFCLVAQNKATNDRRKRRKGGISLPHHDEHCPGCGYFLKVEWSGMSCVNQDCSTVGVCW
jgi:hypothetical protein